MAKKKKVNLEKLTKKQQLELLWKTGYLEFLISKHPKQVEIYEHLEKLEAEETLLLLARQFGKTYFCVVYALQEMIRNPNIIIAVVSPSQKQASEIITPKVLEITSSAPSGLIKQHKSSNTFVCSNGSKLICCGYDFAIESLRGKSLHMVILEEAGSFGIQDWTYKMQSVIEPCLTHSKARLKKIYATTLSPVLHHFLNHEIVNNTKASNTFFKYTIHDNPLLTETRKQQIIDNYGGEDNPEYRREYLCELVEDLELKVCPSYKTRDHIRKQQDFPIDMLNRFNVQLTMDLGGVRDKTGILLSYYDYIKKRYCFFDERFLNPNVPTDIIYKNIIEILKDNKLSIEDIETFHIDSPGQFLVDFRDKFGINAMLPHKNDRDTSIKDFDLGFRKNEIVVSDKCYWLNQTLARGMWDSKRKNFISMNDLGHLDLLMCGVYAYRMRNEDWRPSSHERDVFFTDKRGNEFIDMEVVYAKQEHKEELKKLAKIFGGKIK